VKTHAFDQIISYYATSNNASQLLNANVVDIDVTATIIPVPSEDSSDGNNLSADQIAGIAVGISLGAILLSVLVYCELAKRRANSSGANSDAPTNNFREISFDRVAENEIDITSVYAEGSDKNLMPATSTRRVELSGVARI
jgi:hypothetical protein